MRVLFLTISLFIGLLCNGQQFALSSQLNRNLLYLNPSFTGIYETPVTNLMHRSNWIGANSWSFQNFEAHMPLRYQPIAIGAQVKHEQIGATSITEAFLYYGHRIEMGDARLAFGMKLGGGNSSMGEVSLSDPDRIDMAFEAAKGPILPNFGFGVSFYSKDYYVGLSIPYFLSSVSGTDGNSSINFDYNEFSYILTAGGSFKINNNFSLEPIGAFVYSMIMEPTYSVILNTKIYNAAILGAGYRANEAMIFNAGYQMNNQLSILYSYDYNIGNVSTFSSGSHELGILLYWGFKVNAVSPRDF